MLYGRRCKALIQSMHRKRQKDLRIRRRVPSSWKCHVVFGFLFWPFPHRASPVGRSGAVVPGTAGSCAGPAASSWCCRSETRSWQQVGALWLQMLWGIPSLFPGLATPIWFVSVPVVVQVSSHAASRDIGFPPTLLLQGGRTSFPNSSVGSRKHLRSWGSS